RSDQDQLVLHEGFGVNSAVAGGALDQTDRDLSVEEKPDDLVSVAALQKELDARMLSEKCADETRQDVLRDGGGDAERKFAGELAIFGAEVPFGGGGESRDFPGVAQKNGTLGSENDTIGGAVEEAHTEIALESFDLECDGRLGKKQMLGGLAKIQMLGDGAKNLEAEVLELGHGRIIHGNRRLRGKTQHSRTRLVVRS